MIVCVGLCRLGWLVGLLGGRLGKVLCVFWD